MYKNDLNVEWSLQEEASIRSSKHACIPGERGRSTMYRFLVLFRHTYILKLK